MKNFSRIDFDSVIGREQLAELQQLLQSSQSLSERNDILPFFRERLHLSASVGLYHPDIILPDMLTFEYDIFGDFASDLVVGDSVNHSYCFVEFEDASPNSIFVSKAGRSTPDWSPRFEHGYSQIVDWFWKLSDLERTEDFQNRFNSRSIDYIGLLIIGRRENLALREQTRLDWRQKKRLSILNRSSVLLLMSYTMTC
ncbi:MAG: DUF4263 domain-containing protein [Hormoscilla sp. SP12CHS1]|nr:DUF4263 domain-containing protein [Hormoscilla sp. SP12CHS1]